MRRFAGFFFLILIGQLYADHPDPDEPLFAGTLLANYPENTAPGQFSIEPYFFPTQIYGVYNKHWNVRHHPNIEKYELFLSLETGITDLVDINLIVNGNYNHTKHGHAFCYADTLVLLGFQILRMEKETAVPDFRITLGESFPTGRCNDLDPTGINGSGSGSYQTSVTLITEKVFYWIPHHPIDINASISYGVSTIVKVRGFNSYGGGPNTKGKLKPGDQLIANVALEYSLTRNWALGMDIHYEHDNKSPFSGKKGLLKDGTVPIAGLRSAEIFSLAPCIEYTWSEALSMALGSWFSIAGRNAAAFRSLGFEVSYYF